MPHHRLARAVWPEQVQAAHRDRENAADIAGDHQAHREKDDADEGEVCLIKTEPANQRINKLTNQPTNQAFIPAMQP